MTNLQYTTEPKPMHGNIKYDGDYVGMRFGHLTVLGYPTKHGRRSAGALCECDCGRTERVYSCGDLLSGKVDRCASCRSERRSERMRGWCTHHRKANPANAYKYERLYRIWYGMRKRCENPKHPSYRYYGAEGVKVCDEWNDYFTFRKWAYANGFNDTAPKYQCSIDRINPFGDYEPSNCRWVDSKTQNNNKRAHWLKSHRATA